MMSRILLLIIIAFGIHSVQAQQKMLDSLADKLKAHPAEDTVRLKIMSTMIFYYYESDPDAGLKLAADAIILAKKLKHDFLLGEIYFNQGLNYYSKGDYQSALTVYANSTSIYEKINQPLRIANINNSMGVIYQSLSDYPKALDTYFKNLKLFETLNKENNIALTCSNIGIVYEKLSNYPKSLEYQQKAFEIYRKENDSKGMANTLGNIGIVYDDQNDQAAALGFYQQALEICERIDFKKGVASNVSNMGIAYQSLHNYSEAMVCFETSRAIYSELGDKRNLSVTLVAIGDLMLSAPTDFLKKKIISAANKYPIAVEYYKRALTLSVEIEDVYAQAEEWEKLSKVYSEQKNYGQALEAYKKHIVLRDSIFNDEKKEAVTRMEMGFAFEKKEDSLQAVHSQETALAASEIKRQNTVKRSVIIGTLILFAAAITSFIFYKRRRDAKQLQKEAEFKLQVTYTEMKALRAQMNPHFIFNSLNSVSDYMSKNDTVAANNYLSKFAKLMRLILENSEKKEVPLADDLKALELYMQLEALRMNNQFSYAIKVDPSIDPENTLVPPLILQPFVENSIWHGLSKKDADGKIIITISETNNMLNCVVEDNGVGRKSTDLSNHKKSMGTSITNSRIDILNKLKKSNAAVEITDLPQGTRVEVKLPLSLNF